MNRVVLDTNVYISAVMFGGLPETVFNLALLRSFTLIVSPALLDELADKLRTKFEVSPEDTDIILRKLKGVAEIVRPDVVLHVIEDDPDDNKVWSVR